MSHTQFEGPQLAVAATKVHAAYGDLNDIQTRLNSTLQGLYAEAWKGGANNKFNLVWNAYDVALEKIYYSLQLLGELIQRSGGTYEQTEQERQALVEQSLSDIPASPITSALG
ncbi:MAG: WXG100 family type VII secretion target [Hamadaea sp.]|uniref:WXG100 family type VII secretion target n=1 Tax=Hamadaea sp. TaxID=2024425 RepID=UPI00181A37C5|nr:WXG100 family type VII secretion target [Hamadaea sp.]NUT20409.1 WXG100 family type VII secretion target [Hamadaea sp.]